jgi:hypothetical protein
MPLHLSDRSPGFFKIAVRKRRSQIPPPPTCRTKSLFHGIVSRRFLLFKTFENYGFSPDLTVSNRLVLSKEMARKKEVASDLHSIFASGATRGQHREAFYAWIPSRTTKWNRKPHDRNRSVTGTAGKAWSRP